MALLRGHWIPFLGGVVMGGAFVSTVTLLFWSLSPTLLNEIPVAGSNRAPLAINHLEVRQDSGVVGEDLDKEGCVCSHIDSQDRPQATDMSEIPLTTPITTPTYETVMETDHQSDHTDRHGNQETVMREDIDVEALAQGKDWKDNLVVGVVRVGVNLEWAESVLETWGREVSQLIFYNHGDSNTSVLQARAMGLQLVELRPLATPTSTTHFLALSVLSHMTQHFLNSHLWFLVATGHTYIHLHQLGRVLQNLNGNDPLVIGPYCWRKVGVANHHKMGGALLISRGLMKLLVPCLGSCGDRNHDNNDMEACHHDVGVCLESVMKLHCQSGSKLKNNSDSRFLSLMTYWPVKKSDELHLLQHHYKRVELEVSLATTRALELEVKELCSSKSSSFFSPMSEEECTMDLMCSSQTPPMGQCPPPGTVSNIPPDFKSRTIYDYYPWQYFDVKMVYEEVSLQPSFKLKLRRNLKVELQQVLTRAVQKSSATYGRPLRFKRFVNGWVRHNPFVGNEYIIDYLLMDGKKKRVSHRVSLVRPLAKNLISVVETFDSSTMIHFIVPLSKVTGRFKEFMAMYEKLVLVDEEKAGLVLCVFGDNDIADVKQIVGKYRDKYKTMEVTVLEGKGLFSRSRALELGFASLSAHELAFVCDVDMTITKTFLDRCRSNTVEGKRVYYPEFFKLYNMDYVYWNRTKPAHIRLLREHGHWAYYSFGMLCIYKSDYLKVGGFDTDIVGWGGEDVLFFNRIVRSRIKVMRAPDIGLSHRWHPKECPATLSPRQFKQCLSSREENLADRRELARYMYEEGPLRMAREVGGQKLKSPLQDKLMPIFEEMVHQPSRNQVRPAKGNE